MKDQNNYWNINEFDNLLRWIFVPNKNKSIEH
jgi:hypothetical protein